MHSSRKRCVKRPEIKKSPSENFDDTLYRSRYWAPSRRGPHTKAHENQALLHLTRYRGWGRGRGGNRSKHILFSSTRLCQEFMHLKFFFSTIYNITIVSDLIGSTYLITGYKLESEVRPDNDWQWGRRRYFRKEREESTGKKGREDYVRIIFKNKSIYTHYYATRYNYWYARDNRARNNKKKTEERKGDWRRRAPGGEDVKTDRHVNMSRYAVQSIRLFVPLWLL